MSWFSWRKTHRWLGVAAGCLLGAASAFADDPAPTARQTTELYGGAPLAKPADEKVLQAADQAVNGTADIGAVPVQATAPAQMPTVNTAQPGATAPEYVYPTQGQFFYANNRLIRRQPQPEESQQPLAPVETPQSQVIPVSTIAGDLNFDFNNVNTQDRIAVPDAVASESVTGGAQPLFRNAKDAGTMLLDSPTSSNISLFRRPSATDPHVRGFHQRQLYSGLDGGQWIAARWDLDTIVSKIDSGVVEDVIVIKGPYSAVYGPGFAFIDVVTVPTPRYCCPTHTARSIFNWSENGQGVYGRQVIEGGNSYWGFRMNAGFRTANDYESGNDTLIRGSYKHRDIDFALGYDFTPDDRLEFNYVRLDLTDAEFYNQPTDIDFLVTNGFTGRFESDYGMMYDHYVVDAWYNRTRLAQSGGSVLVDPLNPTGFGLLVNTYVDQITYGSRSAITWGDKDCSHLTLGSDYNNIQQELLESDTLFFGNPLTPAAPIAFDIPRSETEDYGGFFQATDYIGPWTVTTGGRLDFIDIDVDPTRTGIQFDDREFTLWSAFMTAEYQLNCEWSLLLGGGHAERAPGFTELYADDPFIAGMQDGFNFFRGNDQLDKEELWQIDAGIVADYSNMRLALRGFYGWVDNYITYQGPIVGFVNGYSFQNTDATLAGGDLIGDYDLGGGLSIFGNIAYIEGRDTVINQPLYGIYPLQSRAGIRAESGNAATRGMGVEFSARMVDAQDRLASSLDERFTPGFTTFDLRGYWRVNENLLLTSGVLNLSDKNYFEHFDFRVTQAEGSPSFQPGRSVYVGGELTY